MDEQRGYTQIQEPLMRKKQIATISLTVWLTLISLFMLFEERFDLALFFILGFIGFLVIVELMEPRYVKPGYLWYIRILIGSGVVIFSALIIQKVLEMLELEIVLG